MKVQEPEKGQETIIINFPHGLVGLESYHRFALKKIQENEAFLLLQSLDDEVFGLVVTNPFWFTQDYEFELADNYLRQLGDPKDIQVLVTVSLHSDPQRITANLMGPIVLSLSSKLGFQLVLDKGYSAKFKLFAAEIAPGGK